MRWRTRSALGALAVAALAAVGTACSSAPVANGPGTSPAPATADPGTGTTLVVLQRAEGGELVSPSGRITCEVDYHRAGLTQAYGQTSSPARTVTVGPSGTYTTCTGQHCLGNAGTDVRTLPYGTATGVGPF